LITILLGFFSGNRNTKMRDKLAQSSQRQFIGKHKKAKRLTAYVALARQVLVHSQIIPALTGKNLRQRFPFSSKRTQEKKGRNYDAE
jgi:hypothetical protein